MSGMQFGNMEDYVVLEHIGEGSFGKVYKGRRRNTGLTVAMKFITKHVQLLTCPYLHICIAATASYPIYLTLLISCIHYLLCTLCTLYTLPTLATYNERS